MYIIKLIFKSSIREPLRSDTLWGTLIDIHSKLYGLDKTNNLINKFLDNDNEPPFKISSLFPYTEEAGKETFWFPKPLLHAQKRNIDNRKEYKKIKKIKKTQYVSHTNLIQWLKGLLNYDELLKLSMVKDVKLSNVIRTQVAIDRKTGQAKESQLYYSTDYYVDADFIDNSENFTSGFFFVVNGDINLITPLLRFAAHQGIGTDHFSGKGHFDFEVIDGISLFEFANHRKSNSYYTISLGLPTPDEFENIDLKQSSYLTEMRQGRMGPIGLGKDVDNSFLKKSVKMLKEGSIITAERPVRGRIIDVAEKNLHDVYHSGLFLNLPLTLTESTF